MLATTVEGAAVAWEKLVAVAAKIPGPIGENARKLQGAAEAAERDAAANNGVAT